LIIICIVWPEFHMPELIQFNNTIMQIVEILVFSFYAYLIVGFIIGLWFIFKGVQKVDHGMKEVKWILRLMILPGTMILWPVMLQKYFKS